jgi:hypothetical protein
VTRWMSGRNFTPDLFWDRNFIADPTVLKWQVRMVRFLVNLCKEYDNVIAWGLGNENNCATRCKSRDEAWTWTAMMTDAIRGCDPKRPVISGMHGLEVNDPDNHWFIKDQAENNDILTIHPYPYYTPHCHRDRLTSLRTILHAEAESSLYSDIGGKPCLTQELGVLGPIISNEEQSGKYVRSVLWSVWTCGDLGVLWWMAFHCDTFDTPYDWQATERELGFMDQDRNPNAVLSAMQDFKKSIRSLPPEYRKLPKHKEDAVCILSYGQEAWTVAYSAYIIAKQSGFDIRFTTWEDPLPDSDFYMLPSVQGTSSISRRQWDELLKRVRKGACLYISFSNVFLSSFKDIAGLEIIEREVRTNPWQIQFGDKTMSFPAVCNGNEEPYRFFFKENGAEVLLKEQDGNPFLVKNSYGKGSVYTLMTSIEYFSAYKQGSFDDDINDVSMIYRLIFSGVIEKRVVVKDRELRNIALSEHRIDENMTICTIINHGSSPVQDTFKLHEKVGGITVLRGDAAKSSNGRLQFNLAPNDSAIIEISHQY